MATKTDASKAKSAKKPAAKKPAAKKGATIIVEQIGSPIRCTEKQRATLVGLGLNKMHKKRELEDTPSVRGMVNAIPHLARIVEK